MVRLMAVTNLLQEVIVLKMELVISVANITIMIHKTVKMQCC